MFGWRIHIRHVVVQQTITLDGAKRIRVCLPRDAQVVAARNVRDFHWSEATIENTKIVHLAAFEPGVTKPVADGQVRLAALVSDVLAQFVANDLKLDRRGVEEKADTGRSTRPVISERHMNPLVRRDRRFAADFQRIARP